MHSQLQLHSALFESCLPTASLFVSFSHQSSVVCLLQTLYPRSFVYKKASLPPWGMYVGTHIRSYFCNLRLLVTLKSSTWYNLTSSTMDCELCQGIGCWFEPCVTCNQLGLLGCGTCNQVGKIFEYGQLVTCKHCAGSGRFLCPKCGGLGRRQCDAPCICRFGRQQ